MCKHKNSGNFLMEVDGLRCELNMPDALKSKSDSNGEMTWNLPPYNRVMAYKVDEFPACPSSWIHGSTKAGSYFMGIEEGKGMWLDFNGCSNDEHDVAVLISIQGVNPISGQKQDKMRLEQYKNKCPVHDVEFQQDRYCEECGYKWPAQNYMTTTTTPQGLFWLDGFRSEDGKVRQYLFTEDEVKGIAHQVIGKEDKCYAIGVAFFRSKDKKPKPKREVKRSLPYSPGPVKIGGVDLDPKYPDWLVHPKQHAYWATNHYGGSSCESSSASGPGGSSAFKNKPEKYGQSSASASSISTSSSSTSGMEREIKTSSALYSCQKISALSPEEAAAKRPTFKSGEGYASRFLRGCDVPAEASLIHDDYAGTDGLDMDMAEADFDLDEPMITASDVQEIEVAQKFEVGAGALIRQQVHPDNKSLDYYEDEPAGFIYINYASVKDAMKILEAGKREDKKDGYMNGLKVGN